MNKVIDSLAVIGSTGSIGRNALKIAKDLNIKVLALAVNKNIELLKKQIKEFSPKIVAVYDLEAASKLKDELYSTNIKVVSGMDGLCEVASFAKADMLLNSVVGMVGLLPTICAIESGKNVALANKETLVAGGSLVIKRAKEKNVKILPVDSEHSAIFQCLQGAPKNENALKKIILTASGGPFFGKDIDFLSTVKKEQALRHPNWNMGSKITIDSATMMNKGLEIIEAKWLFDLPVEKIDVVIHKESIVHSLIEYSDNSIIAQLGVPDMKIPIQYSFTYPERYFCDVKELNLTDVCGLSFYAPDDKTFKCMNICREAIKVGGIMPAVVNGANEEAVKLFLNDEISFLEIGNIVEKAMQNFENLVTPSLDDILTSDRKAREFVNINAFRLGG